MDRIIILCFVLSLSVFASAQDKLPQGNSAIHKGMIVVKLKSPASAEGRIASTDANIKRIASIADAANVVQVFPESPNAGARSSSGNLQNIYKLQLKNPKSLWRTLGKIQKSGLVEYAEPLYQNQLLYIPNDPEAQPGTGKQAYLDATHAYEGWDIERSDTTMIIGIVDTGVNLNHEDLQNIAINYDDPINGTDDDNDGYVDNFYGWDIADNDNDPTADGHPHGTQVTGMSSAKTNNNIGMAGLGFNARFLPVKIAATSSQILVNDFEGVKYAADQGAKVINLSWGGAGNYSNYGQDIINYAVLEKDAVVVAAAGNTNEELDFYPASFDNILSVGATDINDNKASWATYSYYIDIMAPGDNVFTTSNNGGYEVTTGTSFAAPQVAGAAALVRSRFPGMNAVQVMEQLRVTADDIYGTGQNADFIGKLGKGRLNVQRALSDILTPSVRMSGLEFQSNNGDLIFPGDTVKVSLEFTNYLRTAENLTITISAENEHITLQSSEIYISALPTFQSFKNNKESLSFIVNEGITPGERLFFRIDYLGNFYTDFQYFEIPVTPEYFDISDGQLTATISSDGDIGYNDDHFREGNGITFQGEQIATNSGLIITQNEAYVLDNVINNFDEFTSDQDFYFEKSMKLNKNTAADWDAQSIFRPYDTIPTTLPLRIEQKVLTWENATENSFIIFEYRIINTGDTALSGLNAGIFADWDLNDLEANGADTDQELNLGYVFDKNTNGKFAGLALLSNQNFSHYAIDLFDLNGNTADVSGMFTDSLKHAFISQKAEKLQAGVAGAGNDVAQILGARQLALQPKEATKVAIAMLASSSLNGLKTALRGAKDHYNAYREHIPTAETFYACIGDSATVDPQGEIYEFFQDRELIHRIDSGTLFKTAPVYADTFFYAVNLDSGYYSESLRFKVSPGNPGAVFEMSADTLLIETGTSGKLALTNKSMLGSTWSWDFGNGTSSSVENPRTQYAVPGDYLIELIASNEYGCTDTASANLLVAYRSERPLVEDILICKNANAIISATNTQEIGVYKDREMKELLFQGEVYTSGSIGADTTFYITNENGTYPSVPVPVKISIQYPVGGIEYSIDSTDLTNKYALNIHNARGPVDSISWFINGEFAGSDSIFSYTYSNDPFIIQQVKTDASGCRDTTSAKVEPGISVKPQNGYKEVCKKDLFRIAPQGGDMFYFYEDPQLTKLLHKGHSYQVSGIIQNTSYYVTGVDMLLESAPANYQVVVDPVTAEIIIDNDSILLEEAQDIVLKDGSINAIETFWLDPSGTFDTTKVLMEDFGEVGIYNYKLVAISGAGCSDTTSQNLSVYVIAGTKEVISSKIRLFPNPVKSHFTIDFAMRLQQSLELHLVDASGDIVHQFRVPKDSSGVSLNLEDLPPGIYFIMSASGEIALHQKLIKE